jgi:hypothetical protein
MPPYGILLADSTIVYYYNSLLINFNDFLMFQPPTSRINPVIIVLGNDLPAQDEQPEEEVDELTTVADEEDKTFVEETTPSSEDFDPDNQKDPEKLEILNQRVLIEVPSLE